MASDPTRAEIDRVVMGLRVRKWSREESGMHVIADCIDPACLKQAHLYLNVETGKWDCKRCNNAGALWSLATLMGLRLRGGDNPVRHVSQVGPGAGPRIVRDAPGVNLAELQRGHAVLWNPTPEQQPLSQEILGYLRGRGFDDVTIQRFKIVPWFLREFQGGTCSREELGIGIPYLDGNKVPLVKLRNLATEKDRRWYMRTKGGHSGIFNAHALRGAKQIVLTEGELDAMSLWQCGITAAGSTSLGAKRDIPEEWVQDLVDADDVVLWYDDDEAGQSARQAIVSRLGVDRCRFVVIPEELSAHVEKHTGKVPKDANDFLKAGVAHETIRELIANAASTENTTIATQDRYKEILRGQIIKGELALGAPIRKKNLGTLLRGWRTQEFTIVTGHTNHGKTTFLSEVMEDLARDNEPVLDISLENGAVSIVSKSFQRKLGRPMSSLDGDEDRALALKTLDRLNEWPVYVLDLKGRQPLQVLVDHMKFARRRLGIKYAMVDNLSYIKKPERMDQVEFVEHVTGTFFDLTRDLDMAVLLVVHQNKQADPTKIATGVNLKGPSALAQDPDNIISIFRYEGGTKFRRFDLKDAAGNKVPVEMGPNSALAYVSKVRHDDARRGVAMFEFDPRTLSYREVSQQIVGAQPEEESPALPAATNQPAEDPFQGLLALTH